MSAKLESIERFHKTSFHMNKYHLDSNIHDDGIWKELTNNIWKPTESLAGLQ